MKGVLFIGETWRGSSARSLREALEAQWTDRQTIAAAGQRRAVDAYSIPGRARQVLAHLRALVEERAA